MGLDEVTWGVSTAGKEVYKLSSRIFPLLGVGE